MGAVISNPAQLPLPQSAEAHNPYYAGPDGRRMIDAVIAAAPAALAPGGRLLMVLNSETDFPKSLAAMRAAGLVPRVLGERSLELQADLRPRLARPAGRRRARALLGKRRKGLRDDPRGRGPDPVVMRAGRAAGAARPSS